MDGQDAQDRWDGPPPGGRSSRGATRARRGGILAQRRRGAENGRGAGDFTWIDRMHRIGGTGTDAAGKPNIDGQDGPDGFRYRAGGL